MEKENQRVAVTKQLLQSGLLRLSKNKPIEKISILELCRESGINRATFYRHYQTPRDVLVEMEKNLFSQLLVQVRKPDSLSDVQRYLEDTCLFLESRREVLECLILSNSDDLFVSVLNEICCKAIFSLSELHAFQNYDARSLSLLGLYCSGGSYFILRNWLLGKLDQTPQAIATMAYSLLVNTNWSDTILQLSALTP